MAISSMLKEAREAAQTCPTAHAGYLPLGAAVWGDVTACPCQVAARQLLEGTEGIPCGAGDRAGLLHVQAAAAHPRGAALGAGCEAEMAGTIVVKKDRPRNVREEKAAAAYPNPIAQLAGRCGGRGGEAQVWGDC